MKTWLKDNADHILGKLIFFSLFPLVYWLSDYYVYLLAFFVVQRPLTWTFYLAVMNLKRNRHLLNSTNKVDAYLIIAIGYPLDILYNMTHGTLEHLEMPKETLYTSRTNRHLHDTTHDWHDITARLSAINYLNGFDPDMWHVDLRDADKPKQK